MSTFVYLQLDLNGSIVNEYLSVADAMRINGYNMIYDVCNGLAQTYKGYIWKYKEDTY